MSFEWENATISARVMSIGDDDEVARFTSKLPPRAIVNSGTPFMEFMVSAEIEGESPIPMVTSDSKPDAIAAAYEAWKALPRSFLTLWRQEVMNADNPAPKESASKNSTTG